MIDGKRHRTIMIEILLGLALTGCPPQRTDYRTFADYPGFKEYYAGHCRDGATEPSAEEDRLLLRNYRPRVVLPPGGQYPIDFYRDYLPNTVLRRYPEYSVITEKVTPEILKENQHNRTAYLDLQLDRLRSAGLYRHLRANMEPVITPGNRAAVYGRIYREAVTFPAGKEGSVSRNLKFLKYNAVFGTSGLPAQLPGGFEVLLKLVGFNPEDWHQLDNFVAIHLVLDERDKPIAVILAQHNYHRTYLVGKDIVLPSDGRMVFNIALRSNEVYPDSEDTSPAKHRVVRWVLYMKYLLSGEDPPFFRGYDLTYGLRAGGKEIPYDLSFLSPCDPFYTATILLGKPRPFLGRDIGRTGPPGADYYEIPPLLPLGNLLKFYYLRDDDPEDISIAEEAIDIKKGKIEIDRIMNHGGARFYRDLTAIQAPPG